ncbi:RNA polymerase sigma factor [Lysinibacillus odysseyi]|uniref:RNA polymerase sigma factor n=1 Tax=Lysinibacillus odysseyi 34hs-1 = NBRC 100172 TaxID=1220589 RepID=A0A0A3IR14_9BACI|nr:RNA polymerase sigma factor [Lysinibacillus odysseyi]KGR87219.1 RNA polymerase sigma-70 factor [Lysinibacillus odysseyi 34hs-1 = NBRC 100172]
MDEDVAFINQVLTGDKQAYTHIINKYKNSLYATVLRMMKNPQTAQDLLQEAFVKAYEQLPKFDQKGSFKSWLYRVTINHCLDTLRKKSYQVKQEEIQDEQLVNAASPEIIFLKREKNRELERLIARLPEQERLILLLRYANDCSYVEISELLHIPLSDVRNKLHRAKKKLRTKIEEGGYFDDLSKRG